MKKDIAEKSIYSKVVHHGLHTYIMNNNNKDNILLILIISFFPSVIIRYPAPSPTHKKTCNYNLREQKKYL
jgi:hypothetical protein